MAYPMNFQNEWFSVLKSPFFNGTDFSYWKSRNDCFLKSIDYDIQYIVMNGDRLPKKKVEDIWVLKTHEEFDEKDKILNSKNARAKYYLFCSSDRDVFNSIKILLVHMIHGETQKLHIKVVAP